MNLFLLLLAIAAVSATFFGWLALEYRRTPIDDGDDDPYLVNTLAPTPKVRIDRMLDADSKKARERDALRARVEGDQL